MDSEGPRPVGRWEAPRPEAKPRSPEWSLPTFIVCQAHASSSTQQKADEEA